MSKTNFWKPSDVTNNAEQVWIDRSRLNWEKDGSFWDLLKVALVKWSVNWKTKKKKKEISRNTWNSRWQIRDNWQSRWQIRDNYTWDSTSNLVDKIQKGETVVLTKENPNKKDFVWVYHTNFPKTQEWIQNTQKTNKNFDKNETDFIQKKKEESETFKISKLSKQKDRQIMDNFLNNALIPKLKDVYKSAELLEEGRYKQREALMWVLDKSSLNKWDMLSWLIYEWDSTSKRYKTLVWKDGDKVAWAYIDDPEEKRSLTKGEKVYFVVDKISKSQFKLKEYYPREWDLKIGDEIDLQFANVRMDKILKTEEDTETWISKNKKVGVWYFSVKLWEYSAILDKKLIPLNYRPGKSLKLKIKEILAKNNKLFIKFDQDEIVENKGSMVNLLRNDV